MSKSPGRLYEINMKINGIGEIEITKHAVQRFEDRYMKAYNLLPDQILEQASGIFNKKNTNRICNGDTKAVIKDLLEISCKIKKKDYTKTNKDKDNRRGEVSTRYRCVPFDFVIVDNNLVTVENAVLRELN